MLHRIRAAATLLMLIAPSIAMLSAPATALPSPAVESPFTTISSNEGNAGMVESDTVDGTATVFVWYEVNDTDVTRIVGRWHTESDGWGPAYVLKDAAGVVNSVRVAVVGSGASTTAHVLWFDFVGGALWYLSLGTSGLAGPYLIRNATLNPSLTPVLEAIDPSRAMAVWVEGNGVAATTWAATVGVGGAQVGPAALDDGAGLYTAAIAVVVGRSGRSTALWCATDGSGVSLMQAEAALASDFSTPYEALAPFGAYCDYLAAAQDFYGNMWVALYYADANFTGHVGWSFAPGGSGLGALVDVAQVVEGVTSLVLRADNAGNGVLVWSDVVSDPSTYYYSTYGAVFDTFNGLDDYVTLSNRMVDLAPLLDVEMTRGGGALVFIAGTDPSYEYKTFQYTRDPACSGWSQEQDAGIASFDPYFVGLSLDPTGHGFVAYSEVDSGHFVIVAAPIAAVEAPTFYVDFPQYGAELDYPVAIITGVTLPGALIYAGTVSAVAHASGDFVIAVPVVNGANDIPVDAYFVGPWVGCTLREFVYVSYDDPLVPLAADVASAQAQVAALNASLNETMADLAAAQARVTALETSGNATQADLDEARADLAATRTQLNATQGELSQLKIKFPWLEANLTAARADYDAAQARVSFLESQQNSTNSVVQNTTSQNAALAGQVAVLSIVAFASLIAGIGAMAVTLIQSKRGGGGGKKVVVRGWDPETKKEFTGTAEAQGADAKESSPAQEQLKGNPRH